MPSWEFIFPKFVFFGNKKKVGLLLFFGVDGDIRMMCIDSHASAVEHAVFLVLTHGRLEMNRSRFTRKTGMTIVLGIVQLEIGRFGLVQMTIIRRMRSEGYLATVRLCH